MRDVSCSLGPVSSRTEAKKQKKHEVSGARDSLATRTRSGSLKSLAQEWPKL